MRARFFCKTGKMAGGNFDIDEKATIGSDASNNIHLKSDLMAGIHAKIEFDFENTCYCIENLDQQHNTQVDGVSITEKEKLGNFHVITLAPEIDFIFQVVRKTQPSKSVIADSEKTIIEMKEDIPFPELPIETELTELREIESPKESDRTIIQEDFQHIPKIPVQEEKSIETKDEPDAGDPQSEFVLKTDGDGKIFDLKNGENLIGREMDCDILIDDPSISRKHAIIHIDQDRITLLDLGSRNHTFLEQKKIDSKVELEPGARVWFGQIKTTLVLREKN